VSDEYNGNFRHVPERAKESHHHRMVQQIPGKIFLLRQKKPLLTPPLARRISSVLDQKTHHPSFYFTAHSLHPLTSYRRSDPFSKARRIYAIDIIGQSIMSEDRRIALDDNSYGRWLVEATSALGLDRYDLYGVSWGGFVALCSVRVAPERVNHLILLVPAGWVANTVWAGMRDAGWPLFKYKIAPSKKHFMQVLQSQFTTLDPLWCAYFRDALQAYRLDMRTPPLVQPGELVQVTCPTLIFGAEYDASFPGRALIARVKELLPHAQVELIEGSRHCPPFTDKFRERMSKRIETFLGDS
jgi:pimeloyl-ACP methyl ester carboxylesterase